MRSCGISSLPPQNALPSIEFLFIARYCSARFKLTLRWRDEQPARFPTHAVISPVLRVFSSRPKLRVARCVCGLFAAALLACERETTFVFTRRCGILVDRHRWTCRCGAKQLPSLHKFHCIHQSLLPNRRCCTRRPPRTRWSSRPERRWQPRSGFRPERSSGTSVSVREFPAVQIALTTSVWSHPSIFSLPICIRQALALNTLVYVQYSTVQNSSHLYSAVFDI